MSQKIKDHHWKKAQDRKKTPMTALQTIQRKHGDGWKTLRIEKDCTILVNRKTGQFGVHFDNDDRNAIHVLDSLKDIDTYIMRVRNASDLITVYVYDTPYSLDSTTTSFIRFKPVQVRYYNQQWWYANGYPVDQYKLLLCPTDEELDAIKLASEEWTAAMEKAANIYDRTLDMIHGMKRQTPPTIDTEESETPCVDE